jgi:hypothetical protein
MLQAGLHTVKGGGTCVDVTRREDYPLTRVILAPWRTAMAMTLTIERVMAFMGLDVLVSDLDLPRQRRMFALLGVLGQAIFVDPSSRLVMVHTAVRKEPTASNAEAVALWHGVVNALGGPR